MSHDSFQTEVLCQLGDIKALCATNAAKHEAQEKRIESLEKSNTRQWWFSVAIGPALALAHAALRKFGVDI